MRQSLMIAAVLAALTGCGGDTPDREKPTAASRAVPDEPQAASVAPSASAPPFATPSGASPGAAYFKLENGLAVLLEDGAFAAVKGAEGHYGGELLVSSANKAYFAASSSGQFTIYGLEGATARRLTTVGGFGGIFAVSKDGTLHIAASEPARVRDYVAGKWVDSAIPGGAKRVQHIFADGQGRLWVRADDFVGYRQDGTWKPVTNKIPSYSWRAFAQLGSGVYGVGSSEMQRLDVDPVPDVVPDWRCIPAFSRTIAACRPEQSTVRFLDAALQRVDVKADFEPDAADDSGRAWGIEDGALHVVDPAGQITTYPAGSIPELSRRGRYDGIVVVGAGPKLPAVGAARIAKQVKGKLMRGTAPIANAKLELCVEAWVLTQSTPCVGRATLKQGQTDEKGEFSFTDLPVADYALAVLEDGEWSVDANAIDGLTEGGTRQLPPLVYSEKPKK